MESLQQRAHKLGYLLEDYSDWLGEPAPYKYIILTCKGRHLHYANTLSEIREWLNATQQETGTYQLSLT